MYSLQIGETTDQKVLEVQLMNHLLNLQSLKDLGDSKAAALWKGLLQHGRCLMKIISHTSLFAYWQLHRRHLSSSNTLLNA